jgi:ATP-binding cassette, subfamily C (CFTR/MRP), member 1
VIQLVQLIPDLLQCVGSVERIQEYCNYSNSSSNDIGCRNPSNRVGSSISLDSLPRTTLAQSGVDQKHVITLRNNSFAWKRSNTPFLKDINMRVPKGSFAVCIGAVGSGKSMLLESMLGETISSLGAGPTYTSSVGYCGQQPWLENGTIRSNIIGVSQFDPKWYKTVKQACGLDADFQNLEWGDKTIVGSKGLNLSGGQKQRIVRKNLYLEYGLTYIVFK